MDFSFIYITIVITPPLVQQHPEFRVSILSFHPWCFFSGGLLFALFS
jgi:hypothetical protein